MQIFKAKDPAHHIFFALKVQKDSLAMQQIKSCPIRYWDTNLKVWLIPYSKDNWKLLQNKIRTIPYTIEKEELILRSKVRPIIPYQSKLVYSVPKETKPKIILSVEHQNALLKMKEQLVVKRYQPSTHKSYLSCMTEFLSYYADKKAAEITIDDIKSFMLFKINHDKISENTQNSLINSIKFYYEKVEKREKFYVYDLRPRRQEKLPGFLSKEDTIKLLTATVNIKHRAILQLIYSAGLRLSELTRLKVRDIKFDMGIIEVKCAKGKKDRISVLSSSIKKLLLGYIDQYHPKYWLFEGQDGGQYANRSVQNILKAAVLKSGVDENTTVHTLRHTFATHMILDGVDLRRVQEYLGHSSPETTAIYTHITDKMKTEVRSPLDNLGL